MDDYFIFLNEVGWLIFLYIYFKFIKVDKLYLIIINILVV